MGGGLYLAKISTTTLNTVTVSGNTLVGNLPKAQGIGYMQGAVITLIDLTDNDDPNGNPVQF